MTSTPSDIEFDVQKGHVTFWLGARAHRHEALRRAAITTLVLCVTFVLIFAADYLFAFATRGLEDHILFFVSLGLMSALLGFALGLSRYARTERWTLDRVQQELRVDRMMFGRGGRTEAIDLKHIRALHATGRKLEAVLDDASHIKLVEARSADGLEPLSEALRTFIEKHGLTLRLKEEDLQV